MQVYGIYIRFISRCIYPLLSLLAWPLSLSLVEGGIWRESTIKQGEAERVGKRARERLREQERGSSLALK